MCTRGELIRTDAIVTEIRDVVPRYGPHDVDWVTFVGSGETTLHSGLRCLLEAVRSSTDLPVAVITNGSLLYRSDVRRDLLLSDAVLPSLDAGTDVTYRRINRPHPSFPFKRHVEGLIEFRHVFDGKLWLEVMLVNGVNDTTPELTAIAAAIARIEPDEVHLTLPTRPPVEAWVEPPCDDGLARATLILGSVARLISPQETTVTPHAEGDIIDAVHTIISRHPLREVELVRILARWVPGHVAETLSILGESGRVSVVERMDTRFWCAVESDFADQEPNEA